MLAYVLKAMGDDLTAVIGAQVPQVLLFGLLELSRGFFMILQHCYFSICSAITFVLRMTCIFLFIWWLKCCCILYGSVCVCVLNLHAEH